MRTIFLADAHLRAPDDDNYRQLLRFLEELQGTTDTLCILGDLFDFRIGLPQLAFEEHEPIIAALLRLRQAGTRLIYLEGNHDFQLGPGFAERIGAELYAGPAVVELQGKRVLLCHGDLINRADWRYRLLYHTVRNRALLWSGRWLPASVVHRIRKRLQRSSGGRYADNTARWDYRRIISDYASRIRSQELDAVVLGHFHLPLLEQDDDFTLLAVGDWIGQFSYGELQDGLFTLTNYRP
jgi:UDP-2,3-diacylglucosamine hydrolase